MTAIIIEWMVASTPNSWPGTFEAWARKPAFCQAIFTFSLIMDPTRRRSEAGRFCSGSSIMRLCCHQIDTVTFTKTHSEQERRKLLGIKVKTVVCLRFNGRSKADVGPIDEHKARRVPAFNNRLA